MAQRAPKTIFKGAPMWVVTFADLATLLLTFFVLLLSFSNQDIIKFREMLGSVQGAFGVKVKREGEFQSVLTGNAEEDKKKAEEEKKEKIVRQLKEVGESMKRAVDKSGLQKSSDVVATPEGIRVRVKGESLFASGSYKIKPEARKLLNNLARIIRNSKFQLVVEGHSDNVPVSGGLYKSNWELSGARAAVVTRYLISRKAPKNRLKAAGYADVRPIAPNDTAEGRAKNRRVEFLVRKF